MLASPGVVHRPKLGQPISSNGRRLHVESRKRRVWQRKRIPIRPDINTSTAALAADNPAFEVRNFSLSRVAPHFDRRGLAAGIVQARRDQPLTPARACCRAHVTDAVEGWLIPAEIHSACLRSRESVATIAPDASGQAAEGETSYGAASSCSILPWPAADRDGDR